jgi:hypothetical protein
MWVSTAVYKVRGEGGIRRIVDGGKGVSGSGAVVQRRWIVVGRTEGYPLPALSMAQQPLVGQGLVVIQTYRSYSDTPHSLGLLWTSLLPYPLILPNIRFILIIVGKITVSGVAVTLMSEGFLTF